MQAVTIPFVALDNTRKVIGRFPSRAEAAAFAKAEVAAGRKSPIIVRKPTQEGV